MVIINKYKVGIISDTHGLLREDVLKFFEGSDFIIHAGDIGSSELLQELAKIAPVTAVRGNCDKGELANTLKKTEVLEIGDVLIYVLHDINNLNLDPEASGFNVVISGNSHNPDIYKKNNLLFLNPGSAGPRRFKLPVSAAMLNIEGRLVDATLFKEIKTD